MILREKIPLFSPYIFPHLINGTFFAMGEYPIIDELGHRMDRIGLNPHEQAWYVLLCENNNTEKQTFDSHCLSCLFIKRPNSVQLIMFLSLSRNPTIYNIIHWFAGTNDSSTKCLMLQVLFFFIISCKILCRNPFNLYFYKITKIKIKSFECPKSIKNYKKKIFGTSNAWSTSFLSHRPSKPAYYIVDCRIFDP